MSKYTGWIFDAYHLDNKMVFWLKDNNNGIFKIEDTKWKNYFYLATNETNNDAISDLKEKILDDIELSDHIKKIIHEYKYEKITDREKSKVLRLITCSIGTNVNLAKIIEKKMTRGYGSIRLYNVDLLPVQNYFYEHDLYPCSIFEVEKTMYGLYWKGTDNSNNYDTCNKEALKIDIPGLTKIHLKINLEKGTIPKFSDRLEHISITVFDTCKSRKLNKSSVLDIQSNSEEEVIKDLSKTIQKLDPDIIITENGDSFLFPYLIHRASKNDLDLILGREPNVSLQKPKRDGHSYFSYGRIYWKPSSVRLYGRLHIDTSAVFIWRETQDIHGLVELSQLSKIPLHEASRATIGKCLTSIHLYNAIKKDILIPWKPTTTEHPKTLRELFIADRGGMILEPNIGIHEKVAELDFVSLYPNIINKKNISAETILCDCCYLDSDIIIPELNYHICRKKDGLIPKSLEIVLQRRLHYKHLKKTTKDESLKKIYDARQSALKWILVTSFGYLGFSNAKFGRIDAHIAVCAFARDILLKSIKIAEEHGFEVLHGIIDSIWIKKEGATKEDFINLKNIIEKETGFEISFEGIYKWIAFLSSENDDRLPVINRYFGVFEDGTLLKMRGIETRRHDTPPFFSRFQKETLDILANANNKKELVESLSEIYDLYKKYLSLLKKRQIEIDDLVFTKQLSKDYGEYENRNTIENNVLKILAENQVFLKAGQLIKYVITDYSRRKATPIQLVNDKTKYDIDRYSEILTDYYESITKIVMKEKLDLQCN